MSAQRIILINSSRLLGEIFHAVIYKTNHLEIVHEVSSHDELPSTIDMSEADWLIMFLPCDKNIPRWVDDYMAKRPSMRFLAIFLGSTKVKLKRPESHEQDFEDLSLNDFLHILESTPQQA